MGSCPARLHCGYDLDAHILTAQVHLSCIDLDEPKPPLNGGGQSAEVFGLGLQEK